MFVWMYLHTYIYTYMFMFGCMCVYIHTYIYIYMCYMCVCVWIDVYLFSSLLMPTRGIPSLSHPPPPPGIYSRGTDDTGGGAVSVASMHASPPRYCVCCSSVAPEDSYVPPRYWQLWHRRYRKGVLYPSLLMSTRGILPLPLYPPLPPRYWQPWHRRYRRWCSSHRCLGSHADIFVHIYIYIYIYIYTHIYIYI